MTPSEMLADVENHLKHGAELAASHLPALTGWAADELAQTAHGLNVPPQTRVMLAGVLKAVEAEIQRVTDEARAGHAAEVPAPPPWVPESPAAEAAETPAAEVVEPQVIPAGP